MPPMQAPGHGPPGAPPMAPPGGSVGQHMASSLPANAQVGKTQRLHSLRSIDALPLADEARTGAAMFSAYSARTAALAEWLVAEPSSAWATSACVRFL